MYSLHEVQDSFPHPIPDYLDLWRQKGLLMQYLNPVLSALGSFSFTARPMQVCCPCLRVFAGLHRLDVATAHAANVVPHCRRLWAGTALRQLHPDVVVRHVCVALCCVVLLFYIRNVAYHKQRHEQ